MGPTWGPPVLGPVGPRWAHVGPVNLAIIVCIFLVLVLSLLKRYAYLIAYLTWKYNFCQSIRGPISLCFWYSSWWRHQMKHFPRYWSFVWGIHRSPVNSPHKGQWRISLMFSLIYARINGWVNTGEAGDLRHHHAHYDAILMFTNTCLSRFRSLIWPFI